MTGHKRCVYYQQEPTKSTPLICQQWREIQLSNLGLLLGDADWGSHPSWKFNASRKKKEELIEQLGGCHICLLGNAVVRLG